MKYLSRGRGKHCFGVRSDIAAINATPLHGGLGSSQGTVGRWRTPTPSRGKGFVRRGKVEEKGRQSKFPLISQRRSSQANRLMDGTTGWASELGQLRRSDPWTVPAFRYMHTFMKPTAGRYITGATRVPCPEIFEETRAKGSHCESLIVCLQTPASDLHGQFFLSQCPSRRLGGTSLAADVFHLLANGTPTGPPVQLPPQSRPLPHRDIFPTPTSAT